METKKDLEALVATRMFNPPTAKRKRRAHIQSNEVEKVARRLIAKRDSVDGVPFRLLYSTTAVPDPGVALLSFGVSALEDLMDENYTPGLSESPSAVRKKYEKIALSLKEAARLLKSSALDLPVGHWISDCGTLKKVRPVEPQYADVVRSKVDVNADNVATITHSSSAAAGPPPSQLLSELLEIVMASALAESSTPSHTAWITAANRQNAKRTFFIRKLTSFWCGDCGLDRSDESIAVLSDLFLEDTQMVSADGITTVDVVDALRGWGQRKLGVK